MKIQLHPIILGCSSASALLLAMLPVAGAQESPISISGQVEGGAEYNSNVSVSELDSATGEDDYAALLEAAVDLNWKPAERVSVDAGYSFSTSRFQEFDEFDLDLHLLYGDLSYELDILTVGLNSYIGEADLGGESFLSLKQTSFYAAKLFGDSLYVRGAFNFSEKTFDTFAPRNAEGEGVSADAFWYFNQGDSSFNVGITLDDESAAADQYSYEGRTFRARFVHNFDLLARASKFELSYRLQDRDYLGITPSIDERRDDQQNAVEARLEVGLTERLSLFTQVEKGDYQSNLESADYDEVRAAVGLNFTF